MRTKEELPECPVATAVSLIGGKWKLLLLRNLTERPWRFNELQRSIDGISQKVLTESLAGVSEPSDGSMLAAAQRELAEETGYGGGEWRLLMTVSANPATHNNLTHCFLATGVEKIGEQHLDPTEDLRVHLLTRAEVLELLRTDRIRQSLMAAPLWRYFCENGE